MELLFCYPLGMDGMDPRNEPTTMFWHHRMRKTIHLVEVWMSFQGAKVRLWQLERIDAIGVCTLVFAQYTAYAHILPDGFFRLGIFTYLMVNVV